MKVLFTGASSFTGFWFVRALAEAGHEIFATFRGGASSYDDARSRRIAALQDVCTPVYNCIFGSAEFMDLIAAESEWDLLCHHAAEVRDYHSDDFDIAAAVQANTLEMRQVLNALAERGCQRLLATGSVFEPGEGAGSDNLKAFSPYGVSKALTAQVADYYASEIGQHFGKFVIPNPFGPYEEPRFTAYLMRTWSAGETAEVRTPAYVRDNIHVDLLARAYVQFAESLPAAPGSSRVNPSGYIESQGSFAERFAANMRTRTGMACDVALADQQEFPEPRIRINLDPAEQRVSGWDEARAWDAIASFYQSQQNTGGS